MVVLLKPMLYYLTSWLGTVFFLNCSFPRTSVKVFRWDGFVTASINIHTAKIFLLQLLISGVVNPRPHPSLFQPRLWKLNIVINHWILYSECWKLIFHVIDFLCSASKCFWFCHLSFSVACPAFFKPIYGITAGKLWIIFLENSSKYS